MTKPGTLDGMSGDATTGLVRHRFTVDEYERMGEAGILSEDDRVELLDGEIVEMTPIGPLHASVVDRLTRLLVQRLGDRAIVRVQNPLRLPPRSEPQPDLVVARERADFYQDGHPQPEDVLLCIEVSDSTLAVDRGVKVPLYARSGVAEVWIVDVGAEAVTVHAERHDIGYADVRTARGGQALQVPGFPDVTMTVADVLGS